MRPADGPAVQALVTGILAREYPDAQAAYPAEDLARVEVAYGGTRDTFLVAEAEGRIVGTCGIKEEDARTALLRRLFVDPRWRGQGVGSALVAAAIAHCRTQGYSDVRIRTSDRMTAAIAVCVREGFHEVQRLSLGTVHLVQLNVRIHP